MSAKRTIYGVTTGCYSDYTVDSLFEDKAAAEAYVAAGGGEDVEEFDYYAGTPPMVKIWTATWHAKWYETDHEVLQPWVSQRVPSERKVMAKPEFRAECTDREAAIKSVMDRATAYRARTLPA